MREKLQAPEGWCSAGLTAKEYSDHTPDGAESPAPEKLASVSPCVANVN